MGEILWRFFHARKEEHRANETEASLWLPRLSQPYGRTVL